MAEIHKSVTIVFPESIRHAKRCHDVFQVLVGVGFYTWHHQPHLVICVFGCIPVRAIHCRQHIVERLSIVGQEERHLVGAVAIGQNDGLV